MEVIYRPWAPNVCDIAVDDLRDGITVVDVEYMPLCNGQRMETPGK